MFADSQVRFFECMGGCFREGPTTTCATWCPSSSAGLRRNSTPRCCDWRPTGFRVNVTNCYAGNEKGMMEPAVKAVGNAAFVSGWRLADAAAAQAHLDAILVEAAYAGGTLPPSSMQLFF